MNLVNPLLLQAAMEKTAVVPMPGGQPPPAPPMQGGAPMDPMAMAMPQMPPGAPPMPGAPPAAPGAAPGAPAGGSKKIDPQILYTMIWQLLKLNVTIANHQGITIPPDILLGMPPDPMAQQATQQLVSGMDASAAAGAAGTAAPGGMPPGGDPAAAGGMPPGGDPAAMPKAADDSISSLGRTFARQAEFNSAINYGNSLPHNESQELDQLLTNTSDIAKFFRSF